MKATLPDHLRIHGRELPTFIRTTGVFFAVFYGLPIFRHYVDTSFINSYGAGFIPHMLVVRSTCAVAVLVLIYRFGKRFSNSQILSCVLIAFTGGITLCYFMVKSDLTVTFLILYVLEALLDSLLLVYLWNIALSLFDTRQSMRVFPLLVAVQVLGTTLGSYSTGPLTDVLGMDQIPLVAAGVFLVAAALTVETESKEVGRTDETAPRESATYERRLFTDFPALVKEFPVVRYLMVWAVAPNILLPMLFHLSSTTFNDYFLTEQSLKSFLDVTTPMEH
jgi:ATP/ADP translocase